MSKLAEIHERRIAYAQRWLAHIENRFVYERAMPAESGGTAADRNRQEWIVAGRNHLACKIVRQFEGELHEGGIPNRGRSEP